MSCQRTQREGPRQGSPDHSIWGWDERTNNDLTQNTTAKATRKWSNKRLMSRTKAVHVRYNSWSISLPSSPNQQREMTNFQVFFTTEPTTANLSYVYLELNAFEAYSSEPSFNTNKLKDLRKCEIPKLSINTLFNDRKVPIKAMRPPQLLTYRDRLLRFRHSENASDVFRLHYAGGIWKRNNNRWLRKTRAFSKCFPTTLKRKVRRFQFPPVWRAFSKNSVFVTD